MSDCLKADILLRTQSDNFQVMEKERRVTFRMQRALIKTQMSSVNRVGKILSVCSLYINVSFNLSTQDLKGKASSLSSVTRYVTTESLMH